MLNEDLESPSKRYGKAELIVSMKGGLESPCLLNLGSVVNTNTLGTRVTCTVVRGESTAASLSGGTHCEQLDLRIAEGNLAVCLSCHVSLDTVHDAGGTPSSCRAEDSFYSLPVYCPSDVALSRANQVTNS
jgi:hypothetical protein